MLPPDITNAVSSTTFALPEFIQQALISSIPELDQKPEVPFEDKLRDLRELNYVPCLQLYDTLSKVLPLCPHLRIWRFDFIESIPSGQCWSELLRHVSELEELSVGASANWEVDLAMIAAAINKYCPCLITLSFVRAVIPEATFEALGTLTQLNELSSIAVKCPFTRENQFDFDDMTDRHVKPLKLLTNLRVVNLAGNRKLTKNVFSTLKKCILLENIDVRGCRISAAEAGNISVKTLSLLGKPYFPHLRCLAFNPRRLNNKSDMSMLTELMKSDQLDTVLEGPLMVYTKRNQTQVRALLERMHSKNIQEISSQTIREAKEEERRSPTIPAPHGGKLLLNALEQVAVGIDGDQIKRLKQANPGAKVVFIDFQWGKRWHEFFHLDRNGQMSRTAAWDYVKCTYDVELRPTEKTKVPEAWVHYNCILKNQPTSRNSYRITIPLEVLQVVYTQRFNGNLTMSINDVDAEVASDAMSNILLAIDTDLQQAIIDQGKSLKSFPHIALKVNDGTNEVELFSTNK